MERLRTTEFENMPVGCICSTPNPATNLVEPGLDIEGFEPERGPGVPTATASSRPPKTATVKFTIQTHWRLACPVAFIPLTFKRSVGIPRSPGSPREVPTDRLPSRPKCRSTIAPIPTQPRGGLA